MGFECWTQRLEVEGTPQFVWSVIPSFGRRTGRGRRGCAKGNRGRRMIAVVVKVVVVQEEKRVMISVWDVLRSSSLRGS